MKHVSILVGLPGSGKSYWRNSWSRPNTYICSSDDILESYASTYNTTYDVAFKRHVGDADKEFWERVYFAAATDLYDDIIIDRTNLTYKARKRIMDCFNREETVFKAYVFNPPATVWVSRLNRPGKNIPINVLMNMGNSYEEPIHSEGFKKIVEIAL